MKKILIVVLAFTFMLFTACGSTTSEESDKVVTEERVIAGTDNTDFEEVQENMGAFASETSYSIDNGWIYSIDFPSDGGNGFLTKMRTDGEDYTVLSKKGAPFFINVTGEYIYCVMEAEDGSSGIYRCRLGGDDIEEIVKDDIECFQLTDDFLYYSKYDLSKEKATQYYRSDLDGNNEEMILDKEVYYPYVIGSIIFYQDDKDGETIHSYNMETEEDIKITDSYSYCYIIDGEDIYYIKNDNPILEEDYNGSLVKHNLKTDDETVLYDGASTDSLFAVGNVLYFVNANDEDRIYSINKNGDNIQLVAQDEECTGIYVKDDKLMYETLDEDYYVSDIYLCGLDGSNKIKIDLQH